MTDYRKRIEDLQVEWDALEKKRRRLAFRYQIIAAVCIVAALVLNIIRAMR